MQQAFRYYGQFNDYRRQFGGLPPWARAVVAVAAVPGAVLVLLSLLALGVSILALFLLTVPVYRLLQAVTGSGRETEQQTPAAPGPVGPDFFGTGEPSAGRKRVDVKVVD
jgi:hypothetical protein